MEKTIIKAAGITNLTDARYFAAKGVDWLGLSLDPSQDHNLSLAGALSIREWVDGIKIVGEFGWANPDEINQAIDALRLDAIQVGQFASQETLNKLSSRCVVFREVVVEPGMSAGALGDAIGAGATEVYATVVNLAKNGVSWSRLAQGSASMSSADLKALCEEFALILHLDIKPEELPACLHSLQPLGIETRGGEEEKIGYKSFDELDDWFEALEKVA